MTRIVVPGLAKLDLRIRHYIDQLVFRKDWASKRLIRTFDDIEQDAAKFEGEKYEEWGSDERAADLATQAAYDFENDAKNLRQGFLNLLFVDLFHLTEQQIAHYVRGFNTKFQYKRWNDLRDEYIRLFSALPRQWAEIEKLRLTANVVKHVDAADTAKLKMVWPELFTRLPRDAAHRQDPKPPDRFRFALGGQDLRLAETDYNTCIDNVVRFWEELENLRWEEKQRKT